MQRTLSNYAWRIGQFWLVRIKNTEACEYVCLLFSASSVSIVEYDCTFLYFEYRLAALAFFIALQRKRKKIILVNGIHWPELKLSDTLWCRASTKTAHLFINWQSKADQPWEALRDTKHGFVLKPQQNLKNISFNGAWMIFLLGKSNMWLVSKRQ